MSDSLSNFIHQQNSWSSEVFGPREERGPEGPLAHIREEVEEVAAEITDLEEWADIVLLAIDGAYRAGAKPGEFAEVLHAKQAKNFSRKWGDWRSQPAGTPVNHDRSLD